MESVQVKSESDQGILKVLIADDDAPTRMLLRAAISQWGYQVIEAKDGEEAWELMQQADAPSLIILDWLMPKIDGPTICERSKVTLDYPHYIILLTQVTGTTNIIKGLESGADEFLSKPFNMAELRSRLSTGARIIQYQNRLSMQYAKLQNYLRQLESLTSELTKTADSLQAACFKDETVNAMCNPQIETVKRNTNKISSVLEKLENDLHIKES